ncbi:hypothetical protein PAEPH01_1519 [Pancytospora epiphaga]|nr:hypothetical protein PAEPH01_1519 [Pancytospora epiphaga]
MMKMCEYRTLLGTSPNATSDEILQAYAYKKSELEELLRDARLTFEMKNEIFIQINQLRRAYQILLHNISHGNFQLEEYDNDGDLGSNEEPQPNGDDTAPLDTPGVEQSGPASPTSPSSSQSSAAPDNVMNLGPKDENTKGKQEDDPVRRDQQPGEPDSDGADAPCCGLFSFCC